MTAWTRDEALTFAHHVIAEHDPHKSGTIRLAHALIDAHALVKARELDEQDRLILFTFAADRGAQRDWPATCAVIERVLAKHEAP